MLPLRCRSLRYLHYSDITVPVASYLAAPSLFCIGAASGAPERLHIVRRGVLLYQLPFPSLPPLPFPYLFIRTIGVPSAFAARMREGARCIAGCSLASL